jgi:adenylate cyclase
MANSLLKYSAIVIFILFLSWAYLFTNQSFFSLDNNLRDFLFSKRGELPQSQNIVIIDIDEDSLDKFGQWPWSRSVVSDLIKKLSTAQAGIIGLDIVFSEADQTSPHTIASKLNMDVSNLDNYDQILATTFSSTPTIGGYIFKFEGKDEHSGPLIPAVIIEKGLQSNRSILTPKSVVLNIDILQENFYSSGFFNNTPDTDGMIRKVPLVMRYKGIIYPSLVLEMLRIYSKVSHVEIYGDDIGVEKIKFGDFVIPTDHMGRLFVNFRGGSKHFKYISAGNILNGDFDVKDIAGKFVLVGTSAVALSDLRATPLDNVIPGVEVLANVLDNILQGDFLYTPINAVIYDLLIILCIVVVFSVIFSYLKSWVLLPTVIISSVLLYQIFFYLLFDLGIVLNLLFPILAFSGTFILIVSLDYLYSVQQKEFIQSIFEKKVSKAVMLDLIKEKDKTLLDAQEKEVSIFFSDIRNFTSISEDIIASSKLVSLLNHYLTPMAKEISDHEGTIDKFIGDAIMAYWNAPNNVKGHADKAVKSALRQIKLLQQLNEDLYAEFGVKLKIGIGIHTGVVTVGEIGSDTRSDYTIIGDNVNLASRIEELNKFYDTSIIISKETKEQLKEEYMFRYLDTVRVRGKNQPVELFEVISLGTNEKFKKELEHYDKALTLFRNAEYHNAYEEFKVLYDRYKDTLYSIYRDRCKERDEHPKQILDFSI